MTITKWEMETHPAHAMARDEAAFDIAPKEKTWWRIYMWSQPALTIGVFCCLTSTPPIPWARRITGGGLVLHGHDLTFSVVTDDQPSKTAYRSVGKAIVSALHQLGINAELKGDTDPKLGTFACFSEPVGGDVMVNGRKLAGYAMRRRRGRILIQGSLALSIPPDDLIGIVADTRDYRRNSIALNDILAVEDASDTFALQIVKDFSCSFPGALNYNQQEALEDKIVEQYIQKYSDPDLVPARR